MAGGAIEMELIHYGTDAYIPKLFEPISDEPFRNKPRGGLWTSPVNSEYGWKEWSADNGYGNTKTHIKLWFSGTILLIDSLFDMEKLPWIGSDGSWFISFQALCAMGFSYDAIQLTVKGEQETRYAHPKSLYGWDCETVLIMNPESIVEIDSPPEDV